MNYICEYCNKSYKSSSSLNFHKKTAKFCLNLQKENNPTETTNIQLFNYEYCDKEFTTKLILNNHINVCNSKILHEKLKEQKEQLVKEYKEKIIELQFLTFQNVLTYQKPFLLF